MIFAVLSLLVALAHGRCNCFPGFHTGTGNQENMHLGATSCDHVKQYAREGKMDERVWGLQHMDQWDVACVSCGNYLQQEGYLQHGQWKCETAWWLNIRWGQFLKTRNANDPMPGRGEVATAGAYNGVYALAAILLTVFALAAAAIWKFTRKSNAVSPGPSSYTPIVEA